MAQSFRITKGPGKQAIIDAVFKSPKPHTFTLVANQTGMWCSAQAPEEFDFIVHRIGSFRDSKFDISLQLRNICGLRLQGWYNWYSRQGRVVEVVPTRQAFIAKLSSWVMVRSSVWEARAFEDGQVMIEHSLGEMASLEIGGPGCSPAKGVTYLAFATEQEARTCANAQNAENRRLQPSGAL